MVRTIKRMLYEHFVNIGYCVYYEKKLLPHHYTHLVVVMDDGTLTAIEIGTQHVSANQMEHLGKLYKEMGIAIMDKPLL